MERCLESILHVWQEHLGFKGQHSFARMLVSTMGFCEIQWFGLDCHQQQGQKGQITSDAHEGSDSSALKHLFQRQIFISSDKRAGQVSQQVRFRNAPLRHGGA